MFYTDEEISVITGFLNGYLVRDHASAKVRESYIRISAGLQKSYIDQGRLCLAGECSVVSAAVLVE